MNGPQAYAVLCILQGLHKKKYKIVEPEVEEPVTEIAQPDTATRSGVSLYIVIAIIGSWCTSNKFWDLI